MNALSKLFIVIFVVFLIILGLFLGLKFNLLKNFNIFGYGTEENKNNNQYDASIVIAYPTTGNIVPISVPVKYQLPVGYSAPSLPEYSYDYSAKGYYYDHYAPHIYSPHMFTQPMKNFAYNCGYIPDVYYYP